MIFELSQTFHFEAAHTLARTVPLTEYEPSRRVHGHSYTATVFVTGDRTDATGVLVFGRLGVRGKIEYKAVDLFYLREAIAKVRDKLDHRMLDEVEGLGPATLEHLAAFIFAELAAEYPVSAVTVSRASSGDACTVRKRTGA